MYVYTCARYLRRSMLKPGAFVEAQLGRGVRTFRPNGVYGFEVQVQNPEPWAVETGPLVVQGIYFWCQSERNTSALWKIFLKMMVVKNACDHVGHLETCCRKKRVQNISWDSDCTCNCKWPLKAMNHPGERCHVGKDPNQPGTTSPQILQYPHQTVADIIFVGPTSPIEEVQPLDNLWALDFAQEASKPFVSIRIQSFVPEETSLEIASTVSSQFWWPNLEKFRGPKNGCFDVDGRTGRNSGADYMLRLCLYIEVIRGKWPWLMHRLPTCQNQRPNVNGCEWCTHFFQKLHMNCARARISWFGPKKIWRYDLLDSLAPAMNSFKKWCPWCDFSVVMWLEFFVAPATRDVTAAPWCELSRALVSLCIWKDVTISDQTSPFPLFFRTSVVAEVSTFSDRSSACSLSCWWYFVECSCHFTIKLYIFKIFKFLCHLICIDIKHVQFMKCHKEKFQDVELLGLFPKTRGFCPTHHHSSPSHAGAAAAKRKRALASSGWGRRGRGWDAPKNPSTHGGRMKTYEFAQSSPFLFFFPLPPSMRKVRSP